MVTLNVDQYHLMLQEGILEEGAPIELIEGFLQLKDRSKVGDDPLTVGAHHAWVLDQIAELALEVKAKGGRLRIQQPVTFPPDSEPEPDAVIALAVDYRRRHPTASEITCVIEVSDSSLARDRSTKYRMYASRGIRQYLIVNLVDIVIEEYCEPKAAIGEYAPKRLLGAGEMLDISVGDGQILRVPVNSLLP